MPMLVWNLQGIVESALICLLVALVIAAISRRSRRDEALKYEFITIITHKFRAPLTRVKWVLADLVQSETDAFRRGNLSELQKSNDDLIKLVGILIETADAGSRKAVYQMERLDLCAFVREIFESSAKLRFQEKNISVALNCSARDIFVRADRARLGFVISALLDNAAAYTPTGQNAAVSVSASWGKARISVTDDGIGMTRNESRRVFGEFFRSESAKKMDTEGFGIGLYLSRTIMKRHKGSIKASSPGPNQGSTFIVSLPRAR